MIMTLIGSLRFMEDFIAVEADLVRGGHTVLSLDRIPKAVYLADPTLRYEVELAHLEKIDQAHYVVLIGDGYVGEATARELLWAARRGKLMYRQSCAPDGVAELMMTTFPDDGQTMREIALAALRSIG